MNCRDATLLMHSYFDEDIDLHSKELMQNHIKECLSCKQHFDELKQTEYLLKNTPRIKAPNSLTNNVLKATYSGNRKTKLKRWLINHPIMSSAAIFVILMSISFATYVEQGDEPIKVVNGNVNDLIIEGDKLIVPENKNIIGDLLVENGSIEIKGKVSGDVTVVNGKILMANVSHVNGKTEQVDQLFEWIWFKLKSIFNSF